MAGSEKVARMPPMARLLAPWPDAGSCVHHQRAEAGLGQAHSGGRADRAGADDDDVVRFGSLQDHSCVRPPSSICSGKDAQRYLDEQRPFALVDDVLGRYAFFTEHAADQAVAGLRSARPHAGPGTALISLMSWMTAADQLADLSGR